MLTPIQKVGRLWVKRDDTFRMAGVCGGKARTCLYLGQRAVSKGATGLVTACNTHSPQAAIVAAIAKYLSVACRVYVNKHTKSTPEIELARYHGADIQVVDSTFDNVAELRAQTFAHSLLRGRTDTWCLIPFGMECITAVKQTAKQVKKIPKGVARIVVPVGSGMSLCGVLQGLQDNGIDIPVLGVVVGRDPTIALKVYGPKDWRSRVTLVRSELAYGKPAPDVRLGSIYLDEVYEAKALPYLEDSDLFWIVGHRAHPTEDGDIIPRMWSISAAWANKQFDCTLSGIIARCHGNCCRGKFWPPAAGPTVDACEHLGSAGCTLSPADKPIICHLYPLRLSSRGRLNLHLQATRPHSDCNATGANYGTGPKVHEALRDSFIELFGQSTADYIAKELDAGRDPYFQPPQSVRDAVARERIWEDKNIVPIPRSQGKLCLTD